MRFQCGYCLVILFAILALSCGHGKYGEIIPQKKFVNVLVDIHLADGIAVENMSGVKGPPLDSASLYGSVFNKYGVTRTMFDSTMSYYSKHPDDFQSVYNKVTARLKLMEDELTAKQEEEKKKKTEIIDTILKKGQGTGD
jgi:hypothetical protein